MKSKDINGLSDPYVKVWLMFGEKRVEKKKTPIYKCNLNPTFNQVSGNEKRPFLTISFKKHFQTFEFDVPWEQIRDCSLDISVMDFDTIGRNELIGRLQLGCECSRPFYSPLLKKRLQYNLTFLFVTFPFLVNKPDILLTIMKEIFNFPIKKRA